MRPTKSGLPCSSADGAAPSRIPTPPARFSAPDKLAGLLSALLVTPESTLAHVVPAAGRMSLHANCQPLGTRYVPRTTGFTGASAVASAASQRTPMLDGVFVNAELVRNWTEGLNTAGCAACARPGSAMATPT